MKRGIFSLFLVFFVFPDIPAQQIDGSQHPYVIRGEIFVDLEPIYAGHVDSEYPLDIPSANRRALEEAAMLFSAMIYGWSFFYEPGERVRGINENLELNPAGSVQTDDPGLVVTDSEVRNMRLRVWTDYHLSDLQQRRLQIWRTGTIRNAQGTGYGPSALEEYPGWFIVKKSALEDAARTALRALLRGSERNRPKEVTGLISLTSFPRYFIESGRWAAAARFRVQVNEITPFSAY